MTPHIRIEIPRGIDFASGEIKPGAKRLTTHDRIVAVGEDGSEIDISGSVGAWSVDSRMGEVSTLVVRVMGFEIERIESAE